MPKLLSPPAPFRNDGHLRAAPVVPNRRPVILAYASVAVPGGARGATTAEAGEGAAAFPAAVTVARGRRP